MAEHITETQRRVERVAGEIGWQRLDAIEVDGLMSALKRISDKRAVGDPGTTLPTITAVMKCEIMRVTCQYQDTPHGTTCDETPGAGLEPATCRLEGGCSYPTELSGLN